MNANVSSNTFKTEVYHELKHETENKLKTQKIIFKNLHFAHIHYYRFFQQIYFLQEEIFQLE